MHTSTYGWQRVLAWGIVAIALAGGAAVVSWSQTSPTQAQGAGGGAARPQKQAEAAETVVNAPQFGASPPAKDPGR